MKHAYLGMTAALVGSMAAAGMARAQPHGEGMGGWGGHGMEFLHGLNLSDEQKTQMKAIGKAGWESIKPLMKQEHALHEQEINQLLASGTVTAEQMQPLLAQEEALRTQIDTAHMETMVKMRSVLTADQLSAAATKHAQIEQLHEQEHALMGATPADAPQ
jgi:Spy/CpxP family protein refolding chaperone